jgi:hypothetical protein
MFFNITMNELWLTIIKRTVFTKRTLNYAISLIIKILKSKIGRYFVNKFIDKSFIKKELTQQKVDFTESLYNLDFPYHKDLFDVYFKFNTECALYTIKIKILNHTYDEFNVWSIYERGSSQFYLPHYYTASSNVIKMSRYLRENNVIKICREKSDNEYVFDTIISKLRSNIKKKITEDFNNRKFLYQDIYFTKFLINKTKQIPWLQEIFRNKKV